MTLHKTLSQNLPPADEIRQANVAFLQQEKDADGYHPMTTISDKIF